MNFPGLSTGAIMIDISCFGCGPKAKWAPRSDPRSDQATHGRGMSNVPYVTGR